MEFFTGEALAALLALTALEIVLGIDNIGRNFDNIGNIDAKLPQCVEQGELRMADFFQHIFVRVRLHARIQPWQHNHAL